MAEEANTSTNNSDKRPDERKSSGIKLPSASRIGRPCMLHMPAKPSLPAVEPKNGMAMHRPTDDILKSPLSDVYEETETDLVAERSSVSPPRYLKDDRKQSSASLGAEWYLEATGRRRSSDHGAVLTVDTDSFIIGQRVWVGGMKPGQIAFIGETHFAPGEWAGIVLDEPHGKNDGCVSGKRYFQCEPKKGIFSRLTRLTHQPLQYLKESSPVNFSKALSPERSRTASPTSSIRSSALRSPGKHGLTVGDRVIISSGLGSRPGLLRYIGETKFAPGNWCGIQLDDPNGKNDGSIDGTRYFDCPPKHGIFVPIAKVSLSPTSKKNRISRAGSRESLTSVGTMNSVATTNTSRLRMNAQKLMSSSSTKPVSASRTTNYSLQDIIREKQNHIEQLMIERDLDREDAQNQALSLQKTITELKKQISDLEGQLQHEKRKTEDLQTSVDEATFCGDELNAQTQVYKEKIAELENQLYSNNLSSSSTKDETDQALVDIVKKNSEYSTGKEEQLQDEVNRLLMHIKDIESQLLVKDENHENLYLNVKDIQNQNDELTQKLAKIEMESNETIQSASTTNIQLKFELENKKKEIDSLQKQINEFNVEIINLRKMNVDLVQEKSSLNSVKSLKESESASLLLEFRSKSEQLENKEKQLENTNNEIHAIKENNEKLTQEINELRSQKEFELNELALKFQDMEGKLSASTDEYKRALNEREARITELQKESENYKLIADKQTESFSIQIKAKEAELKDALAKMLALEGTLVTRSNDFELVKETLQKQIESLNASINELKNMICEKDLELEALRSKQEGLNKITLELQNSEEQIKVQKEERDKIIDNMRTQIETLQNENNTLKQQLVEKDVALQELLVVQRKTESDLEKQNNENTSLSVNYEDKIKTLADKITKLEDLLEDKQSSLKTLEKQVADQNEVINHKSKQVVELESCFNASQEGVIKLTTELEELKTKYEILEKTGQLEKEKFSDLDLKFNDLERRLKASLQKSDELQCRNDSLLNDLNNLKNSSNDSNSELIRLTESFAAKEKSYADLLNSTTEIRIQFEKELESNKCSLAAAQNRIITMEEQLKEQIEKRESFENQCKAHEKIKTELESSIKEFQCEIKTLQTKLENLKSEFEQKEKDLVKEKEQLITESQTRISILEETQISEQDLRTSVANKNQEVELLRINVEKKDLELRKALSELSEVSLSFENRTAEMKQIRDSLEVMSSEFNKIKSERDAECLAKESYASKLEDLQNQLKHKEEEQVDLVVRSHDLERDISTLQSERDNLAEKINELLKLNEDLLSWENSRKELEKENQQLQDLIKNQAEKIENITKDLTLNKKETEEKMLSLQQKDDLIKKYVEEITELTKTSEMTKKHLQEKQMNLQEQIGNLEAIIAEKDEKYSEMKNKLLQIENNKPKNLSSSEKQAYENLLKEHNMCKDNVIKFEQNINKLNEKIQVLESANGGGDYILQASSSDSLTSESNEAACQINFLNSIIAEMQVKNETLKEKVQTLESFSNDFTQFNFEKFTKRTPAPRVYCDICDKFDSHETDECPMQSSESPPPSMVIEDGKPKVQAPPRKYCEKCEVFGHAEGECEEDETF